MITSGMELSESVSVMYQANLRKVYCPPVLWFFHTKNCQLKGNWIRWHRKYEIIYSHDVMLPWLVAAFCFLPKCQSSVKWNSSKAVHSINWQVFSHSTHVCHIYHYCDYFTPFLRVTMTGFFFSQQACHCYLCQGCESALSKCKQSKPIEVLLSRTLVQFSVFLSSQTS